MEPMKTVLITAFLALNVAAPLSYYFGDDAYDERFAWRMFSPVRLAKCSVELSDGATVIRPNRKTHQVWINLMRRARRSIFEGYARQYCAAEKAAGRTPQLFVKLRCDAPDMGRFGICRGRGADRDRDGVPDGYTSPKIDCDGLDPAACLARDCGDESQSACRKRLCERRPISPDENFCATVGIQ